MDSIKFSPPDITELEINEVIDTLKSGWITTGPKTKLFEKEIAKLENVSQKNISKSLTVAKNNLKEILKKLV